MGKSKNAKRMILKWAGLLLFVYLLIAYLVLPRVLRHYSYQPELERFPKTSFTKEGLPGDSLNVGLVGNLEEVVKAMDLAGWVRADALKLKSDFKISESVVLKKSYRSAPLSRLYLFGRKQDLSFEEQVDNSPRERHHVRFWKTTITSRDGRPLWIGAATFDKGIGISHETGKITHHIAPDVDKERDFLMADLVREHQIKQMYQVSGVGLTVSGRNGSGDRYFSDGELTIGVLSSQNKFFHKEPKMGINPFPVEFKNNLWQVIRLILGNKD